MIMMFYAPWWVIPTLVAYSLSVSMVAALP